MDQFENQQQILVQNNLKKKWNWKKLVLLAGVGAIVVTSASLITWGVTKQYITKTPNELPSSQLPETKYQTMNVEQFNQIHKKFISITNPFIKSIATGQLMFYLPSTVFNQLEKAMSLSQNLKDYNLTPNLEKILNTVGSNLRVWGLNKGFSFDLNLAIIINNTWNFSKENNKIKFDLNLGYKGSTENFGIKGVFLDSEYKTFPISEFNKDNLERIFTQANNLFKSEINRNGYFVGLNFNGNKNIAKNWLGEQIVDLQEFNSQVWDYVLNSLKNFNLVKENVFTDGIKLFTIDGWNPDNIYIKAKEKIKVDELKNQIWLPKESDFGSTSIVSKVNVSYKTDKNINFEFSGSYLQNDQWGNY